MNSSQNVLPYNKIICIFIVCSYHFYIEVHTNLIVYIACTQIDMLLISTFVSLIVSTFIIVKIIKNKKYRKTSNRSPPLFE